jgi:hypothetical protein
LARKRERKVNGREEDRRQRKERHDKVWDEGERKEEGDI